MRTSTIENCLQVFKSFNGWQKEFDAEREKYSKRFPFTVIIEGAYPEYDMAEKWLFNNFGPESDYKWKKLWFDKTDYDYGFSEFYFKEKKNLDQFIERIPSFYGIGPKGKWKTDGSTVFKYF